MFARPYILPVSLLAAIALAMAVGGPIAQLPDYHAFADQRTLVGIANAADVLSNFAFLAVGHLWTRPGPARPPAAPPR